jgi:hypothetical protein
LEAAKALCPVRLHALRVLLAPPLTELPNQWQLECADEADHALE